MISHTKGCRYIRIVLFLGSVVAFFGAVLAEWGLFGLALRRDYAAVPIVLFGIVTSVALLFNSYFLLVYRSIQKPARHAPAKSTATVRRRRPAFLSGRRKTISRSSPALS